MNRVFIGIILGVLLSGPVSAAGSRYFAPMTQSPSIVAGVVDKDGTIRAGHGFTVTHPAFGEYVITFDNVLQGCASMVVNQTGGTRSDEAFIATVSQPFCRNRFNVRMWSPGSVARGDKSFHFVVVQAV